MKNSFNDLALAILRVSFSGILLTHGIPKINMLLEDPSGFPDLLGIGGTGALILAIIGEVVAPLLVIVGYKTRLATIPAIITMGVAVFMVHANDDFATKEKALLFLCGFLVIALAGAGRYSIDGRK